MDPTLTQEIRRFEEQHAENPDSFVFARLADAYGKAGRTEHALEVVERGLRRHPRYLSAHIVRARILRELDRRDEAVEAYRRVLEIDPDNILSLRALGDMARERGAPEEARRWYERLAELEPLDDAVRELVTASAEPSVPRTERGDDGPLTATMADLCMKQGLYEQAASIYERLLRLRPDDFGLLERLKEARRRLDGSAESRGHESDAPSDPPAVGPEEREAGEPSEERSGPTIRAWLTAVLEGAAPAPSDGARRAAWLRGEGAAEG